MLSNLYEVNLPDGGGAHEIIGHEIPPVTVRANSMGEAHAIALAHTRRVYGLGAGWTVIGRITPITPKVGQSERDMPVPVNA